MAETETTPGASADGPTQVVQPSPEDQQVLPPRGDDPGDLGRVQFPPLPDEGDDAHTLMRMALRYLHTNPKRASDLMIQAMYRVALDVFEHEGTE